MQCFPITKSVKLYKIIVSYEPLLLNMNRISFSSLDLNRFYIILPNFRLCSHWLALHNCNQNANKLPMWQKATYFCITLSSTLTILSDLEGIFFNTSAFNLLNMWGPNMSWSFLIWSSFEMSVNSSMNRFKLLQGDHKKNPLVIINYANEKTCSNKLCSYPCQLWTFLLLSTVININYANEDEKLTWISLWV